MKPSGIGGMAVMEGVMMKNKDIYAVAVRKPDNEITVEVNTHKNFADKVKLFRLPIFRGMLAFVDSMMIGIKVLNYSASFYDDEDEATKAKIKSKEENDFIVEEVLPPHKASDISAELTPRAAKKSSTSNALLMVLAVLISIIMSVALFMVLPVVITDFISGFIDNHYTILFIEGMTRLAIFIGYVLLASRMNEIKRVFMYHGAEHKTINCLENGFELTVENVRWQSKQHKRCGTSFMLFVILISLIIFMFMPISNLTLKIVSRIVLVPFIAGVSYEFIRFAGRYENKLVRILSQPGLWMQGLTTREPDDAMIEVAIRSVSAVFDWKEFQENRTRSSAKGKTKKGSSIKNTQKQGNNATQVDEKQVTEKPKTEKPKTEKPETLKPETDKKVSFKSTSMKGSTSVSKGSGSKTRPEVKPQIGGLAYTGTVPVDKKSITMTEAELPQVEEGVENKHEENHNAMGRNRGMAPISLKSTVRAKVDEEDDEILKALDKFFDEDKKMG